MEAINTINSTRQFDLSSMAQALDSGAAAHTRSSSVQMFSTEHTEGGHGPVQPDDMMGMRRPMHADHANGAHHHANGAHHPMSRDAEAAAQDLMSRNAEMAAHHQMPRDTEMAAHELMPRNAEMAAGPASANAARDAIAQEQPMAPPTGEPDAAQNGADNMAAQPQQATAPAGAADGAQNGLSNILGGVFQTVIKGLQGLLSAVIPSAGQLFGMLSPLMGMLSPMLGKPGTGGTGTA